MSPITPHLYFSRRRMLNRLSFVPRTAAELADPMTNQTPEAAWDVLLHLESMGLADERVEGWTISDEGIAAMAANGVIYADGIGR